MSDGERNPQRKRTTEKASDESENEIKLKQLGLQLYGHGCGLPASAETTRTIEST